MSNETTWTTGKPGAGRYYEAADINGHRVTIYAPRDGDDWPVLVAGELLPQAYPTPAEARAAGVKTALALACICGGRFGGWHTSACVRAALSR
jgi:hypothetical protein